MPNNLVKQLRNIAGHRHVRTGQGETEHFRRGWRSGGGHALAVVFPQTFVALWQVLQACIDANAIIIMQAANTGLTEGSTPSADGYDREIVIINILALDGLTVLGEGQQVLCYPGTTLHHLETTLKPLQRAPHSVIGSSCLGASVIGGIANNSGGALVKRGPAYTEMALFAWVNERGELQLVNHLGIELGGSPVEILTNLQTGNFATALTAHTEKASATDYPARLRDVDADTPSRFNADPTRLFEASGCAGKIAVFAVRLDTYAVPKQEQTFYIGTNNADTLTQLRRHMLQHFAELPEVAEYMHRDTFTVAKHYGKDTFLSVQHLGTQRLPSLFAFKGRLDSTLNKLPLLPSFLSDRVMQHASSLLPQHLPPRLLAFEHEFEHHLILKMSDAGIAEAQMFLRDYFADETRGAYFECTPDESSKAFLHRFAAAGAAIRFQTMHASKVGEILALDIALRRNDRDWVEHLPESLDSMIEKKLYYGHFFCHVFHQDYILKSGVDPKAVKTLLLGELDKRGAKYPAEHNVGHLYQAESSLQNFYKSLDPTNTFNPGIGGLDKHKRNCGCC
ncbi:D-lactate dehydrogenase [Alteromonas flava]|uniref:D-lactate dehydrogenase n=1 Tax=Alteromonas flava TaxID=2048003 RepID=UPI000C28DFD8|nr:D-lactate dehydrogenase [Alteromonas flava]